jgi:hypothetical protein
MFSLANSSIISSYMITIGCALLCRLQGRSLPPARYSLGKWGIWINIASLIFLAPIYVFSFFPPTPSPEPQTMNWGCLIYGSVIIFSTIYYIAWGRKNFIVPEEGIDEVKAMDNIKEGSGNDIAVLESAEVKHDYL